MNKRHNRRQRKKLHLGEFQELGFCVSAVLNENTSAAEAERACDSFITDCIEANQLGYGGAVVDKLHGFVVPLRQPRYSHRGT
ncbi:YggL family protein [Paraburkholderia sp. UCT2]|uniref:YggL family protein n=1 Tax=Paraburkholderia sp. UCT2 TaxID=2615208 RepID=UPI00223C1D17|nr:YggL family protein [Paraburkholderia sp. UCT2]